MKIKCARCGRKVEAKHPSKRFCGSKCKDRYHNLHNPRGTYRHLAKGGDGDIEDDFHPFDSYALGFDTRRE